MTAAVREKSCADWLGKELTDFQRTAVEVVVEAMNTGPWNLPIRWERVDWACGSGVRFCMRSSGLSTFDFDHLTRFVLVAHERCVRVDLAPASRGYFYIYVHPRDREAAAWHERHPTIEQAIAKYRGVA